MNTRFPENIVVTIGTMDGEPGKEWKPMQELYCKRKVDCMKIEGTDQRREL